MELNLNIEQYLSRFKIYKETSLFPLTMEEKIRWIKQEKCPICQRRIYWNADGTKGFCKSKFKDRFFISRATFDRIA